MVAVQYPRELSLLSPIRCHSALALVAVSLYFNLYGQFPMSINCFYEMSCGFY
jgi:hypothetical protein